jgi:hypothetical protein
VQVRVSHLTAAMILYMVFYVLYIRLTVYGSMNGTSLLFLAIVLAVSLIIFFYSLSVRDKLTFRIRR